jgi:lantibiotic modifying enzyme
LRFPQRPIPFDAKAAQAVSEVFMATDRGTDALRIARRQFLGGVALAGTVGAATAAGGADRQSNPPGGIFDDAPTYRFAATETARWIRSAESRETSGLWLPEPDHPEVKATVSLPNGFYSGSAGLTLFFIELARATEDPSYWDDARRGGDYLVRSWKKTASAPPPVPGAQFGLYTGLAGTVFALAVLWKATGDSAYRDAAHEALDVLLNAARPAGAGIAWVDWPGLTGDGGIVLALLTLADLLGGDNALRSAAIRAGDRIVEQAVPDPRGGLRWQGMPAAILGEPEGTYWPNFQLGTSGTAYALARLGAVTGEKRFLAAAEAGALHLQRIATVKGDAALIHYREPDAADLYYLGYCNGPAGTARLFYQLNLVTKNPNYLQWTEMLARGVMASGIPDRQTPGFWNVVCQCCGSAGVVDFFTGLWAATDKPEYHAFARRVADQMLSRRADFDGEGYRWYQAYTRIKPWDVVAETGYMVGAAGIAVSLLHLDMAEQGKYRRAILPPDNPFPASQT